MKKYGIGIDIGGTKISMILGTRRGKILARRVIPTRIGRRTRQGLQELIQNLKLLIAETSVPKDQIGGIGIGLPGPVDSKKGVVPLSPHMTGWRGIPLRKWVSRELKLPVAMTNDANAAVLGEKFFGDGRGKNHVIYLTVSTGIGGGLIANGELVEGAAYVGGEVGHMTVVPKGNRCKCGKSGCLEAYASGTAIVNFVKRRMQRGKSTRILKFIPKRGYLSAREVGLAARTGDALALQAYREAGFYLGIGIANLLNILNPEIVCLGGGVWKSAPPVFWHSMLKSCQREAWPDAFRAVKMVRTKLADHVGDLGALALAFEKMRS
jgi:glucokinase